MVAFGCAGYLNRLHRRHIFVALANLAVEIGCTGNTFDNLVALAAEIGCTGVTFHSFWLPWLLKSVPHVSLW